MEPLIITIKPGSSYKSFEPSESDTFIYCLEGCVTLTLGKERYQAYEGDVFYFRANELHQLHNNSENEVKILIVATDHTYKGGNGLESLLSFKKLLRNLMIQQY